MVDEPLHPVVQAISGFKHEAHLARIDRLDRNAANRRTLRGDQDYSKKVAGQSADSLPKLAVAYTALSSLVQRGLTGGVDWFSVEVSQRSPISDYRIREIMKCFINHLYNPGGSMVLPSVISNAVKAACTDSLMIVKVLGAYTQKEEYVAERGEPFIDQFGQQHPGPPQLVRQVRPSWRLSVDLVPDTDYYPDPQGKGLYEIHSVVRGIHELDGNPLYDQQVVNKLKQEILGAPASGDETTTRREDDISYDTNLAEGRREVRIDEFWGTLLDKQGNVMYSNAVCASANQKYLIRPPVQNPLWHGESPFVVAPLFRIPHSVWHKAIFDDAARLNESINELYNLMFDGGLSSVWGVRQVRRDLLKDPESVSGGIPPHKTIEIAENTPEGVKVVETVSQGDIPGDAFGLFNMIDREFQQASLTNDVRLGNLPPRRVKATEIIESQESQSLTIDSILKDCEDNFIEPLLRKSWLTCLQFSDMIPFDHYEGAVDANTALIFQSLPQVEKFIYFGQQCNFRVYGLSQSVNKVRNFQKLTTILQVVGSNPVMLQAFVQKYSPFKIIESLLEALDIKPSLYELTVEERTQLPAFIANLPAFSQFAQQGGSLASEGQQGSGALNNPNINLPQ